MRTKLKVIAQALFLLGIAFTGKVLSDNNDTTEATTENDADGNSTLETADQDYTTDANYTLVTEDQGYSTDANYTLVTEDQGYSTDANYTLVTEDQNFSTNANDTLATEDEFFSTVVNTLVTNNAGVSTNTIATLVTEDGGISTDGNNTMVTDDQGFSTDVNGTLVIGSTTVISTIAKSSSSVGVYCDEKGNCNYGLSDDCDYVEYENCDEYGNDPYGCDDYGSGGNCENDPDRDNISRPKKKGGGHQRVLEMPYSVRIYSIYETTHGNIEYRITQRKNFTCTGTLVSIGYVLSAAHCFHKTKTFQRKTLHLGLVVLFVGQHADTDVIVDIHNIVRHPCSGDASGGFDIALLRLPYPMEFSEYIQVIELTKDTDLVEMFYEKSLIYAAGWSWAQNRKVMFRARMQIIPNIDCLKYSMNFKQFRYYCAQIVDIGRPGLVEFGCGGRSGGNGGPLVVNNGTNLIQIGVMSMPCNKKVSACANFAIPLQFLRLQLYMKWLCDVLDGVQKSTCKDYPIADFTVGSSQSTMPPNIPGMEMDWNVTTTNGALDILKKTSIRHLAVTFVANICFVIV